MWGIPWKHPVKKFLLNPKNIKVYYRNFRYNVSAMLNEPM
jgi:hypothetical protein